MVHLETSYRNLAAAICVQAVLDYRSALRRRSVPDIQECLDFFGSGWFYSLCGMRRNDFIERISDISTYDIENMVKGWRGSNTRMECELFQRML